VRANIQLMQTFLNLASTFGLVAARLAGIPILASAIRDSRDIGFVYRVCRVLQAYGADILLSNSEAGLTTVSGIAATTFVWSAMAWT
jgi:hypothetical protein